MLVSRKAPAEQLAKTKRLFIYSSSYEFLHLNYLKSMAPRNLTKQLEKVLARYSQGNVQFDHWQAGFYCY